MLLRGCGIAWSIDYTQMVFREELRFMSGFLLVLKNYYVSLSYIGLKTRVNKPCDVSTDFFPDLVELG